MKLLIKIQAREFLFRAFSTGDHCVSLSWMQAERGESCVFFSCLKTKSCEKLEAHWLTVHDKNKRG